ncbi:hypothetical protein Vretimale_9112 [Volvox reticuliferus]|uniref:CxC3 like cysteine cluster domain-containing protein n=1 Tax=Volvox reticuliferus TaxID=1737510 RepID=A0A8J4LPE1_9CHLO|nr:hypothetical protein Vretifemale_9839 [Volvox reticuliferus]GIM04559.1 hypothetical protein Vretimale_9112 [Volvox reticuliferus]
MYTSYPNPFLPPVKKSKTNEGCAKPAAKPSKQPKPVRTSVANNEQGPLLRTKPEPFEGLLTDYPIPEIRYDGDGNAAVAEGSDISNSVAEEPEDARASKLVAEVTRSHSTHVHNAIASRRKLQHQIEVSVKDTVAAADAAIAKTCPTCGTESCGATLSLPVTVVTWDRPIDLKIPGHYCDNCRRTYSVKPTTVDCLHDAMPGWDVSTRRDGVVVIWWHRALLQQFDLLERFARQISVGRFCASMVENWGYNGFKESIVTTTCLYKRLSKALFLYRYLKSKEEDYPEGLPRARGLVAAADVAAAAAGVVNAAMVPAGAAAAGAGVMEADAVEAVEAEAVEVDAAILSGDTVQC